MSGRPASPARDEKGSVLVPLVRSRASASELASFPVEIVFVETPKQAPETSGTLHVELPTLSVPLMQVMYTYDLPPEGYYPPLAHAPGFKGRLRPVQEFAMLASAERGRVVYQDANAAAAQLQQQLDQRIQAQVRETGATPIRVRLPINGKQYKFERILVLPGDKLWFEMTYSNWKAAD